jgi:hypothetical protein
MIAIIAPSRGYDKYFDLFGGDYISLGLVGRAYLQILPPIFSPRPAETGKSHATTSEQAQFVCTIPDEVKYRWMTDLK